MSSGPTAVLAPSGKSAGNGLLAAGGVRISYAQLWPVARSAYLHFARELRVVFPAGRLLRQFLGGGLNLTIHVDHA